MTSKKKWVIAGLLLAAVVVATAVYIVTLQRQSKPSFVPVAAADVCDESTRAAALDLMKVGDYSDRYGDLVKNIRSTKDYQRDANCLFIAIKHDIAIGDVEAAKSDHAAYDTVLPVFHAGKLDRRFDEFYLSPDSVGRIIESMNADEGMISNG